MNLLESDSSGSTNKASSARVDVFNERQSHFINLRYGVEIADMINKAIEGIGPAPTSTYALGSSFSSVVYDIVGTTKLAVSRLVKAGYSSHGTARILMLNAFLDQCAQTSTDTPRFLPVMLPSVMRECDPDEKFFHMKLCGNRGEAEGR